jgi:hypothetical protein
MLNGKKIVVVFPAYSSAYGSGELFHFLFCKGESENDVETIQ